jgi:hypothetical protein
VVVDVDVPVTVTVSVLVEVAVAVSVEVPVSVIVEFEVDVETPVEPGVDTVPVFPQDINIVKVNSRKNFIKISFQEIFITVKN